MKLPSKSSSCISWCHTIPSSSSSSLKSCWIFVVSSKKNKYQNYLISFLTKIWFNSPFSSSVDGFEVDGIVECVEEEEEEVDGGIVWWAEN